MRIPASHYNGKVIVIPNICLINFAYMNTFVNNPPYLIAADDEQDLLTLFKISMKAKGFKVGISTNAKNLWALLRRKQPDVLFLDIQMEGVDGG